MLTIQLSAAAFADKLLSWYDLNKRHLPWRENPTPYHVWLSEIMLQQTQVQTVLPYYQRFIEHLPTIEALAQADSTLLYKLWEGLGYYNRANNLQKAAKTVCENYQGQLPEDYSLLLTLSGIGPYTAGAIASIAFGQRVSAVDGNVLRILSRITAYDGAINVPKEAKPLHQLANHLVPAHRPGDFNQALMDLGATICSANGAPHCTQCPLIRDCLSYEKNLTGLLPFKKPKKPRLIEYHTIIVLQCQNQVFLHQRPAGHLLAGLWEFIDIEEHHEEETLKKWLSKENIYPLKLTPLGASRHIFTHKEWSMIGYHVIIDTPIARDGLWVPIESIHDTYAIPGALHFYRNQLFDITHF